MKNGVGGFWGKVNIADCGKMRRQYVRLVMAGNGWQWLVIPGKT